MSIKGTDAYTDLTGLPSLVEAAVVRARATDFGSSCLPSQGRLLQVLAGGVPEGCVIGETGTGAGVGTGWLASGARPGVEVVTIEREPSLVAVARQVFAATPSVRVVTGDWSELRAYGPFDLLVLDGGGQGKGVEPPIEPREWLGIGGVLVVDDFTPVTSWPPLYDGHPDLARLHWLQHPQLSAAEVRTGPDAATIVATFHR